MGLLDYAKTIGDWKKVNIPKKVFLKTGVAGIDDNIGGFAKGGTHLIVGTTKSGKSLTMLHLAGLMSKRYTILYISCENDHQTDRERREEFEITYNDNMDDVIYVNMLESNIDSRLQLGEIKRGIVELMPDIVFIDGTELLINSNGEGADLYENGKMLTESMTKLASKCNCAIVMSWQTTRGNKVKKIEDITSDDVSSSIAAARTCASAWVVHRKDRYNWDMKLLLCRSITNNDDTFSVYDTDTNTFKLI